MCERSGSSLLVRYCYCRSRSLPCERTGFWLCGNSLMCPHVALVQDSKSPVPFNRGLSSRAAASIPWSHHFSKHSFLPRVTQILWPPGHPLRFLCLSVSSTGECGAQPQRGLLCLCSVMPLPRCRGDAACCQQLLTSCTAKNNSSAAQG